MPATLRRPNVVMAALLEACKYYTDVVMAARLEACKCYHITVVLVAHTMSCTATAAKPQVRAAESEPHQKEKFSGVTKHTLLQQHTA